MPRGVRTPPQEHKGSPSTLVSVAKSLIEDLIGEIDENLSNMEDKFSGTEKYQNLETAKEELERISGEIEEELEDNDLFEELTDLSTVTVKVLKVKTKRMQLEDIKKFLDAAASTVRNHIENNVDDNDNKKDDWDTILEHLETYAEDIGSIEP